jgi:uncharacterized membrane protein
MTDTIYTSVDQYLDALKAALAGAPKAVIADALADCEEHLRGAIAAHPEMSEAEVFADMARSYGSPEEVAAEYRATDMPPSRPFARPETRFFSPVAANAPRSWTMFNVFSDMRTYGAMIYMLLSLVTGVFYFTWAVTGTSLTAGLAVLIIGIPFFLVFMGSVRLLGHVEGRIVEALLGVRMPRRLAAGPFNENLWERIKSGLSDIRTWSTLFYMFLMLPLGIAYFVIAIVGLAVSGGLVVTGVWGVFDRGAHIQAEGAPDWMLHFIHTPFAGILFALVGMLLFFVTLHVARAVGWFHGRIAEHLLVRL